MMLKKKIEKKTVFTTLKNFIYNFYRLCLGRYRYIINQDFEFKSLVTSIRFHHVNLFLLLGNQGKQIEKINPCFYVK